MKDSYLILDENLRFLNCCNGRKEPTGCILDIGVQQALRESGFDEQSFITRGRHEQYQSAICSSSIDGNSPDIEDLVLGSHHNDGLKNVSLTKFGTEWRYLNTNIIRTGCVVCGRFHHKKLEQLLFSRSQNTGFMDGKYSLVAGHVHTGESVVSAVIREAEEEAEAREHQQQPVNLEPFKCSELSFFALDHLPGELCDFSSVEVFEVFASIDVRGQHIKLLQPLFLRKTTQIGEVWVFGEKKLAVLEPPDKWKDGARNTTKADQRKIGANKLLKGKQNRFNPYDQFNKCKICKTKVHQKHAHYCQGCSYKHGMFDSLVPMCWCAHACANVVI
eukprot:gene2243-5247_t